MYRFYEDGRLEETYYFNGKPINSPVQSYTRNKGIWRVVNRKLYILQPLELTLEWYADPNNLRRISYLDGIKITPEQRYFKISSDRRSGKDFLTFTNGAVISRGEKKYEKISELKYKLIQSKVRRAQ